MKKELVSPYVHVDFRWNGPSFAMLNQCLSFTTVK